MQIEKQPNKIGCFATETVIKIDIYLANRASKAASRETEALINLALSQVLIRFSDPITSASSDYSFCSIRLISFFCLGLNV